MKLRRSILIVLASTISVLMVAESAVAGGGNGPNGAKAAVAIDGILLMNQNNGSTLAEISGGGFLNGGPPAVTLDDGTVLAVDSVSETLILATIPQQTADGEYTVSVTTSAQSKGTADFAITLGGTMAVVCVDWFRSGPRDEHVHTEVHVEDEYGNAVVDAVVTWTSENDSFGVYQTNVSPTLDNDGHADGQGCQNPSGSGVTGWFCCIGAGSFDGEIPGKRACAPGRYTAEIISVTAPPSTNMEWDGDTPPNEIFLDPKPQ